MKLFQRKSFITAISFTICSVFNQISAVKIGFFIHQLIVTGVEVSVYDYADLNETILGNESIILNYNRLVFPNDFSSTVREKYVGRFGKNFYDAPSMQEIDVIIKKEGIDIFYAQKSGESDEKLSKVCKNAIHSVYELIPHGNAYATISETLSNTKPQLNIPFVPLVIRLADTSKTLHRELGISNKAVIFGRHGG